MCLDLIISQPIYLVLQDKNKILLMTDYRFILKIIKNLIWISNDPIVLNRWNSRGMQL